jgi:hypothetical protein
MSYGTRIAQHMSRTGHVSHSPRTRKYASVHSSRCGVYAMLQVYTVDHGFDGQCSWSEQTHMRAPRGPCKAADVQVHVAKSLGASTLAQSARTRTLTHTYPWPVCYSCAVAAKWSVYEAGLRVPLILRWPRRIPRGVASAAMVTRLTDHTVHTHPLHALLCIKIHEGDEWCTRIPKAVDGGPHCTLRTYGAALYMCWWYRCR